MTRRQQPATSFAEMSIDDIAQAVKREMQSEARKWRRAHPKGRAIETAATKAAALYLQRHHELYMHDDTAEMKAAHQRWMTLLRAWFLSALAHKESEQTS